MQAEPDTTRAANTVGRKKSNLDLLTKWTGKHITSDGLSKGILRKPWPLHGFENDDDGDIADTKAISGPKDATATANVRRTVHIAAHSSSGHRDMTRWKSERKEMRTMMGFDGGLLVINGECDLNWISNFLCSSVGKKWRREGEEGTFYQLLM